MMAEYFVGPMAAAAAMLPVAIVSTLATSFGLPTTVLFMRALACSVGRLDEELFLLTRCGLTAAFFLAAGALATTRLPFGWVVAAAFDWMAGAVLFGFAFVIAASLSRFALM